MGWARLSMQAREGSGYNYSASELARGLALSGHTVSYLRTGMDYSIRPGIRTRRRESWEGVDCHDLVNSPNLSPSYFNFDAPQGDVAQPALVRVILKWLDERGVDLVHIHSMEGLSNDLIRAIRQSGRPVLVSLHNYSVVCPQVDLLRKETSVCMDYDGGRACVGCLTPPSRRFERTKRRVEQCIRATLGPEGESFIRHCIHIAKMVRARRRTDTPYVRQPDPELALGFEVDDAGRHSGEIEHNHFLHTNETPVTLGRAPMDQNERFLRADHHLTVLNDYGTRRVKGIEALNEASLVTPPSRFLLDVHRTMGLKPERSRHVRLGQPHFDQINRRTRRSPFYDVRPWSPGDPRPCRFGFWGTTRNNKGLEILVSAIPLLDRDVRRHCQFLIRAGGWEWTFRKRLSRYPEVQFAGGYDELQLIAGGGEYDVGILPHVWFE
ncbi:MAG: glycosyltransferase, partial [Phycisphaerales bacterium]|nr:glycosyltransferase [Phycisphaerales bacterium]